VKIVVCLKAVPTEVTNVGITETGEKIDFESPAMSLNESDEYALEEALVLKRQFCGEVIVITAGPLRAQEVLYKGLAKNADRAVRVDARFGDAERTSTALAEAIDKAGYDLVLTGVESSEDLAAEVGVRIAERLRLPYAYAVTDIEAGESTERIKVTKEIGGGTMEVLDIPLPALLCIQAGIQPMSYVPVRRLHQARGKPVECLGLDELGVGERKGGGLKIVDIFPPSETGRAELIEGKPSEIGRRLLEIIEGRSS
jgi:electron transfer flavoprotein beta subunit